MHVLYLLTFPSGKRYVGQTVRALVTRVTQHRGEARRGSQLPVHCAWRKYGEPTAEVLATFETHEELHRAEIDAIASMGTLSPAGYNLGLGGETSSAQNPEVAAKIAASATGRKHADTTPWSDALRKQWQDPEYRARIVAGLQKVWTPEMRAAHGERSRAAWATRRAEGWQMPEAQKAKLKGRTFSDEARARMSASAKGKVISEATKAKMSAASSARKYGPQSEERRQKISAGIKAAWARRKQAATGASE